MDNAIIIVPARMGSTRFPNKPLADICGKPMVVRVLEQAKKTGIKNIIAAAAEQEIYDEVIKAGFQAILTEPDLPSGTDRIFQALEKFQNIGNIEYIVNLQGDLPTIEPEIIEDLLRIISENNYHITTAVTEITEEDEKTNPNVVKAIVSWNNEKQGRALYFTRATAPHNATKLYHHIGLYVYTKQALKKFVSLKPSELEKVEKLEQLRALENDMNIGILKTSSVPLGVDTKEDLAKAIKIYQEQNL